MLSLPQLVPTLLIPCTSSNDSNLKEVMLNYHVNMQQLEHCRPRFIPTLFYPMYFIEEGSNINKAMLQYHVNMQELEHWL